MRTSRQLFRYVARGVLMNALVAFLILEAVQAIVVTVRATEKFNFDLLIIFPVLLRAFGEALFYTVPVSLLFGTALFVGRLKADCELLALESFGLSPVQKILPLCVVGMVLSGMTFVINQNLVPRLRFANRNVATLLLDQLAYLGEGWDLDFTVGSQMVWIHHHNGPRLEGVFVSFADKEGRGTLLSPDTLKEIDSVSYPVYLFAKRALVSREQSENALVIELHDVDLYLDNDFFGTESDFVQRVRFEKRLTYKLPFSRKTRGVKDFVGSELPAEIDRRYQLWQDARATADENAIRKARRNYYGAVKETHRRIAISLSALTFPLAAFALGLYVRSKNRLMPFFVASTVVPGIYFGLKLAGDELAIAGWAPWATQEAGNFALAALIAFLLWRVSGPPRG